MIRVTLVSVAGQSFTVTQAGLPCTYSLSQPVHSRGYGAATNSFTFLGPGK